MTTDKDYFEYLSKRSVGGYLYRKMLLYPTLNRHLPGLTLDIGCGIGDFLKSRENVIGVDINEKTVAFCKSQGHLAKLMHPDQLPFEKASFDSIILDNVLEHVLDPKPLLREIARVLRPGGTVVIGVPGELGYASESDHKVFYTSEKLAATLAQFQFKEQRIFSMPLNFSFLSKKLRSYCIYGVYVLG